MGACIGNHQDKLQQLADTLVQEHEHNFERLLYPSMPLQVAMLLLRAGGLSRFNYLARTSEPSVTAGAAVKYDERLCVCVCVCVLLREKVSISVPPASSPLPHNNTVKLRAHLQLM